MWRLIPASCDELNLERKHYGVSCRREKSREGVGLERDGRAPNKTFLMHMVMILRRTKHLLLKGQKTYMRKLQTFLKAWFNHVKFFKKRNQNKDVRNFVNLNLKRFISYLILKG